MTITQASTTTTWRTHMTLSGTDTVVVIALDADGGTWLCRSCDAHGTATDHVVTRGEAAAHLDVCVLHDPPAVLTAPVRALTLTGATGTEVVVTGHAWRCGTCARTDHSSQVLVHAAIHAETCGAADPQAVARYITTTIPAAREVVDEATTQATSDLRDRIVRLTDDLRDTQALADVAVDERDEARRRYDQDVAADIQSDIRDLRGEAGRADTKASILAAAVGAGLVAGVHALSTGALSVPVTATGGAAGLAGVGVIGVLLTVLRPRVSSDEHALVTSVIGDDEHQVSVARERVQEPNLDGMATEKRTMQRIVATKYGRIGHAVTATGVAVVLAVAAIAIHIITG